MVSSTPRLHFNPGKDPVPIVQETGWAAGPVWTGGKSRPHRDSIPYIYIYISPNRKPKLKICISELPLDRYEYISVA